jgi:hypothetical protein
MVAFDELGARGVELSVVHIDAAKRGRQGHAADGAGHGDIEAAFAAGVIERT